MRSFSVHALHSAASYLTQVTLVIFLWLFMPVVALGAGLSFSPSSGTYQPGSTVKVGVYVNSEGKVLNAVSGLVTFPSDTLEVVSVSKGQSIVSLWVQEPSFSNADGTVRFEGVVLNPGYSGSAGKVIDITFAVKAAGEASLVFTEGSILANDGEGSEILTSRGRAQFTIAGTSGPSESSTEEALDTTSVAVPALLPEVVAVASTPTGWLAETTGVFNFALPEGVVAMRLLLDTKPNSTPTVVYQPPIASKTIEGLEEGTSYLHVQYKNADGWGEVLHHEIRVDTTAPNAPMVKTVRQDTFLLSAEDGQSGIERYEVDVDGGEKFVLTGEVATVFVIPASLALSQGQHVLTVRAVDQAGNTTVTTTTFDFVPPVNVATSDDVGQGTETPDHESPVYSLLVPNGAILITVLSVIVPLLALIILLGILVYAAWRALGGLKRRVDKEAKEANEIVRRAFFVLRSDLEVDIETLKKANEKRKLTREESKILKRLQANINTAEQVIGKEISDIENEVNKP